MEIENLNYLDCARFSSELLDLSIESRALSILRLLMSKCQVFPPWDLHKDAARMPDNSSALI